MGKSTAKKTATSALIGDPRQQLMDLYDGLTEYKKDVMEVLSLFYMPVGKGKLCDALRSRGVRDENGAIASSKTIRSVLLELKILGLVAYDERGVSCARLIVELITRRMLDAGRFQGTAPIILKKIALGNFWFDEDIFESTEQAIARLRLAVYARDFDAVNETIEDIHESRISVNFKAHPITTIITNPFDSDWLDTYPPDVRSDWLMCALQNFTADSAESSSLMAYARDHADEFEGARRAVFNSMFIDFCFIQGRFDEAFEEMETQTDYYAGLFRARHFLLSGDAAESAARYEACLAALKKATRKRKPVFASVDWLFFILALIDTGQPAQLTRARELAGWGEKDDSYYFGDICMLLGEVIDYEQGGARPYFMPDAFNAGSTGPYAELFVFLAGLWISPAELKKRPAALERLHERARSGGNRWIEAESAEILHRAGCKAKNYATRAAALRKKMNLRSLADVVQPKEAWERALSALEKVEKTDGAPSAAAKKSQLAWFVSNPDGYWEIRAKEQKQSKNGRWSKGRVVSLKRLVLERDTMDFLSKQDRKVCAHVKIEIEKSYWGRGGTYYSMPVEALASLVGHPLVFDRDTLDRIDVVRGEPELLVKKVGGVLRLTLNPPVPDHANVHVEFVGDTRIVVYEFTPDIRNVAAIVRDGVNVPAKAKPQLIKAIGNIASLVTIHSDIGGAIDSIPKVDADASLIVQLLPAGEGLIVQLRVQPFSGTGPFFAPGIGGETVISKVDGTRTHTERNLAAERARADKLVSECPTLLDEEEWDGEWRLHDPAACLEFLLELRSCTGRPRIVWPKGEKYNVRGVADLSQFHLNIRGGKDWFEIAGEIQIDDSLVLDMRRLLELTKDHSSRFVDMGDGQFVALTQAFRKKLDELRTLGDMHGEGLRMHVLAFPVLEELAQEAASLKADKKWREQIKRLKDAETCDSSIPSTLRAELRDYQIDGYRWLVQLAAWGVGACLADDMGLGKTVQILAVMLKRAPDGPQLVVAPTSVCMNWETEAKRFAPTLKIQQFGTGDREKTLMSLGAFDVVVASYSLLHIEAGLFQKPEWNTIVLDEAQAIKNTATKRSKAAMALNGAYRIIATGTPIENHLGELWNLFRFINPGLLGSLDRFNQRFAVPIEKYQKKDERNHLKRLIQPFILRRLKGDVLDELPPRTDIVLHVELSKEERVFYEAIRLNAVEALSGAAQSPGQRHVRILAEIMRLRRACCNAKLVEKDSDLPSAKMEVLEAVLEELLENRHKALVFSQFVGHLAILRECLDRKGVSYQYLDGSTPRKSRQRAIDAFQAGEGDLFLISLKAGGLGLNLTAADYVIHMDPWWNPAVEDQASDRAHRIGQQRPVTVYRLVAKDTIEDKIVALHHQKRDLADSLLEGSDMAGRITSEQLLDLLKSE